MVYNLTDLKLFLAIAEERSLTRGAARSHLSLSAASLRIKNLEQALGVRLFERGGHSIALLPAGHTLLRHAHSVMCQMGRMEEDMVEHAEGAKTVLRVFMNTAAMCELPSDVLQTFLIEQPDVNIDLREQLGTDIVRGLQEGSCDIGIVGSDQTSSDLDVIDYRSDQLVLITAAQHPLARGTGISFSDTLRFDFIGQHEGHAIQMVLGKAATKLGRKLMMRIQVGNYDVLCRMVGAGIGIGIVPLTTAQRYAQRYSLNVEPILDEWASRDLSICVRRLNALPPAGKQFIDMLLAREHAGATPARPVQYS